MFFAYAAFQIATAVVWGSLDFSAMKNAGGSVTAVPKDEGDKITLTTAGALTEEEDTDDNYHRGQLTGGDAELWEVVTSCSSLCFFLVVTTAGALSGIVDTFLFIFLKEIGGGESCMGAARLIMCAAEVPFFKASGQILDHLGTYGTLSLVGFAYAVRFSYYGLLTEPWSVLPAEVLHGITFAALWSASVSHAQKLAPEGRVSVMQGLVESLHWGVGYGLGSLIGGFAYDDLGPRAMFFVSAGCSVVLMLTTGGWELVLRSRSQPSAEASEFTTGPAGAA